jgi:hypothetical protein
MTRILLTEQEEILLVQFHEKQGDRTGAKAGDRLPLKAFEEVVDDSPGLDFEGALDALVNRGLLSREGDELVLTPEGYGSLYTREGGFRQGSAGFE